MVAGFFQSMCSKRSRQKLYVCLFVFMTWPQKSHSITSAVTDPPRFKMKLHRSHLFFLQYAGLSLLWPLPLRSTASGRAGSAAMAHGPSRSACGIFLDRGTNPCPLHRQADTQPLRHQGSPLTSFLKVIIIKLTNDCKDLTAQNWVM